MILPFSQKFPDGKPTYFAEKIYACKLWTLEQLDGFYFGHTKNMLWANCAFDKEYALKCKPKKHTIRQDLKGRWKAGNKINPVYNNRTKEMFQFSPPFPCKSTQKIEIKYNKGGGVNVFIDEIFFHYETSWGLEWDEKTKFNMNQLAINDGFDSVKDFFNWFKEDYTGKIIHFTDLRY